MMTFLDQIVEQLITQAIQPAQATYVVPSRRVATFLRKSIAARLDSPQFAPAIYSVEDFIAQLAGVTIVPDADLLFDFYEAYAQVEPADTRDSIDEFLSWAPMMLKDFNEIDRFLVPQESFFNYLGNLKALENPNHWSLESQPTKMVENYLSFWDRLHSYYLAFKKHCEHTGFVYQGLGYRLAFAKAQQHLSNFTKEQPLVFLGLNALNKAEEEIIQVFLEDGNTHIFWDADEYLLNDPIHEAGKFLRSYKNNWKYYQNHDFTIVGKGYTQHKKINITGVTGSLATAQVASNKLNELLSKYSDLTRTAIILADERLLLPVLNALPPELTHFNVTMGMPLDKTPLVQFYYTLIKLHQERTEDGFYFKNVLHLLESPFAKATGDHQLADLLYKIRKENQVFISSDIKDRYDSNHILHIVFDTVNSTQSLYGVLQKITGVLKDTFLASASKRLELEQLLGVHATLQKMESVLSGDYAIQELKTFLFVFRQLIAQQKIDFIGEPVQGLQIMGLLETRALDYDNYIMVTVNEGVLPAGKSSASVIPYDMKLKFGLPTYSDKDSVYAYHFYRLLHRAQQATFIYDTAINSLGSNERSRFLLQLESERGLDWELIKEQVYIPSKDSNEHLHKIEKTAPYFARLEEIRKSGFSPSALTSYVYDPLTFYKNKILKLSEVQEVEEDMASNTMGSIVHKTLEKLYNEHHVILHEEDFKEMNKRLDDELLRAYKEVYDTAGNTKNLTGRNKIIYEVSRHYVKKMLDIDLDLVKKGHELVIKEVEKNYNAVVEIDGIGTVRLHGEVDRIDQLDGVVRIIDYKTGKVESGNLSIDNNEPHLLIKNYKKSKAFQVLQYAYMYLQHHPESDVQAGVISFKNLQAGFISYRIKNSKDLSIKSTDMDLFVEQLTNLLKEIYDKEQPLIQEKH